HLVDQGVERLSEIESRPGQVLSLMSGTGALLAALPAERWGVVTSATRRVSDARLAAAGGGGPPLPAAGGGGGTGRPGPGPLRPRAQRPPPRPPAAGGAPGAAPPPPAARGDPAPRAP